MAVVVVMIVAGVMTMEPWYIGLVIQCCPFAMIIYMDPETKKKTYVENLNQNGNRTSLWSFIFIYHDHQEIIIITVSYPASENNNIMLIIFSIQWTIVRLRKITSSVWDHRDWSLALWIRWLEAHCLSIPLQIYINNGIGLHM